MKIYKISYECLRKYKNSHELIRNDENLRILNFLPPLYMQFCLLFYHKRKIYIKIGEIIDIIPGNYLYNPGY